MFEQKENQDQPQSQPYKEKTIQDIVKDLESYIRLAGLIMAIGLFLYGGFQMIRVSTIISSNERLGKVDPNVQPSDGHLYGAMISNSTGPFGYIKNFFEMQKIQRAAQNDFNETSKELGKYN
jgi:hypothetical protein